MGNGNKTNLSHTPPENICRENSSRLPRDGTSDVRENVKTGTPQHVFWLQLLRGEADACSSLLYLSNSGTRWGGSLPLGKKRSRFWTMSDFKMQRNDTDVEQSNNHDHLRKKAREFRKYVAPTWMPAWTAMTVGR